MEIMDRIQELIGRTLSPIESYKLQNILKKIPEEVILEACMMSIGKERPLDYMFKVLYYIENPLAERPVKKKNSYEEVDEILLNDEWLKDFNSRHQ